MYACNAYVDEQALGAQETDPERMKAVLQTLFIAIRDLAIAIQPVVPEKAAAVLDQLGIADAGPMPTWRCGLVRALAQRPCYRQADLIFRGSNCPRPA